MKNKIKTKLNQLFPYIKVESVQDYFDLPREKRTKWGVYLFPLSLPWDIDDQNDLEGWGGFDKRIKKEFPIQFFLRETIGGEFRYYKHRLNDLIYQIKCYFRPKHQRLRNAIPNTWTDTTSLIVILNFEMVKEFYEEEYIGSHVDWDGMPHTKKFARWLEKAYKYITAARPALEKEIDETLTSWHDCKIKHIKERKFKKLDRLEKMLKYKDDKVLKEIIENRQGFWT